MMHRCLTLIVTDHVMCHSMQNSLALVALNVLLCSPVQTNYCMLNGRLISLHCGETMKLCTEIIQPNGLCNDYTLTTSLVLRRVTHNAVQYRRFPENPCGLF